MPLAPISIQQNRFLPSPVGAGLRPARAAHSSVPRSATRRPASPPPPPKKSPPRFQSHRHSCLCSDDLSQLLQSTDPLAATLPFKPNLFSLPPPSHQKKRRPVAFGGGLKSLSWFYLYPPSLPVPEHTIRQHAQQQHLLLRQQSLMRKRLHPFPQPCNPRPCIAPKVTAKNRPASRGERSQSAESLVSETRRGISAGKSRCPAFSARPRATCKSAACRACNKGMSGWRFPF